MLLMCLILIFSQTQRILVSFQGAELDPPRQVRFTPDIVQSFPGPGTPFPHRGTPPPLGILPSCYDPLPLKYQDLRKKLSKLNPVLHSANILSGLQRCQSSKQPGRGSTPAFLGPPVVLRTRCPYSLTCHI